LLTKLDGSPVLIGFEAVKYIESVPDTLVFFLNGDSLMVKESLSQILAAATGVKVQIAKQVYTDAAALGRLESR
jgi:flagellar protein FlbD